MQVPKKQVVDTLRLSENPGGKRIGNDISSTVLEALRLGDHAAFEKVYYFYSVFITRFLLTLTRSEEIADDITQETFVKLWEKHTEIDPLKNIRTYLYTIARNTTFNYYNRQKLLDDYVGTRDTSNATSVSAHEELVAKETEILIRIMVERMPKMRGQVFKLSHYQGLSHDEIASQLKISKKNVADHVYQATKEIKQALAVLLIFLFP